jgi:osmoprotectant transport system substrate-binding protein
MRKYLRSRAVGAALIAFAVVASACGSGDDAKDGPEIVIGSFGFGESEILGEIYRQGLVDEGYTVSHNEQIGPREIVKPALESGDIGFVPEYLGSALEVGFGGSPSADAAATRSALATAFAAENISVLAVAPAEDKNAFAVTRATAESLGVVSVSDLAKLPQPFALGGPPECPERPRCLLGLRDTYGFDPEFVALDAGGPLTITALKEGEIDVALFFSTFIFDAEFVRLEDDGGLQPAENIVPVVRNDIVDAYGDDFVAFVDSISAKITTDGLTEMNRLFLVEQRDASVIAHDWLVENGFISE